MSDRHEIATAEINGGVYVAEQDGLSINICGPDGDNLVKFFGATSKHINELTLRLIVLAYYHGMKHGANTGKAIAQLEMRQALGL